MRLMRVGALLILAYGIAYLWTASTIKDPTTYAAVGPRFIPYVIGIGIVISGIWLWLMSGDPIPQDSPLAVKLDWLRVGGIVGLLVLYLLAFRSVGYILSTIVLVFTGSQVLSEPQHWKRDALSAIGLVVITSLVFTHLLGIALPRGLIGW